MKLDEIDKAGLIAESYRMEGISDAECRSIFLDWAVRLPAGIDSQAAVDLLLRSFGRNQGHPMTAILVEARQSPARTGRRGGASARRP